MKVSLTQRVFDKIDTEMWSRTMAGMSDYHPGFKAVQKKIAAKEGVSAKAAGAILASATRKASKKARKKNPRLNRVK